MSYLIFKQGIDYKEAYSLV